MLVEICQKVKYINLITLFTVLQYNAMFLNSPRMHCVHIDETVCVWISRYQSQEQIRTRDKHREVQKYLNDDQKQEETETCSLWKPDVQLDIIRPRFQLLNISPEPGGSTRKVLTCEAPARLKHTAEIRSECLLSNELFLPAEVTVCHMTPPPPCSV